MLVLELTHPTDPRYLRVATLPERASVVDLVCQRYGWLFLLAPGPVDARYPQPDGPGTDWVRPAPSGDDEEAAA